MTTTIREMLSEITTRDDAGVHFMNRYPEAMIKHCELAGLIKIHRPVHAATGMDFDVFHWTVELTKDGEDVVNERG